MKPKYVVKQETPNLFSIVDDQNIPVTIGYAMSLHQAQELIFKLNKLVEIEQIILNTNTDWRLPDVL